MKTALRALLLAPEPDVIGELITGQKCISIRAGHRDYVAGQPILIGCHRANWAVMADVVSVNHCKLNEVSRIDLECEGFVSTQDALWNLRRFYPEMQMDSPVTVLRWECVRGALVGDVK